jgi:hypothetical protein
MSTFFLVCFFLGFGGQLGTNANSRVGRLAVEATFVTRASFAGDIGLSVVLPRASRPCLRLLSSPRLDGKSLPSQTRRVWKPSHLSPRSWQVEQTGRCLSQFLRFVLHVWQSDLANAREFVLDGVFLCCMTDLARRLAPVKPCEDAFPAMRRDGSCVACSD